jgi:hypothetical protein
MQEVTDENRDTARLLSLSSLEPDPSRTVATCVTVLSNEYLQVPTLLSGLVPTPFMMYTEGTKNKSRGGGGQEAVKDSPSAVDLPGNIPLSALQLISFS